jgi:hypothetical protein
MAHLYEKAVSCEMCFPTPLLKENPHLWCVASRMRMYVDVCGRMLTCYMLQVRRQRGGVRGEGRYYSLYLLYWHRSTNSGQIFFFLV